MAPTLQAPPGSLAAAIDRASAYLATDAEGARREAEAILRAAPNDPRALLILASAHRRLGNPTDARVLLESLARAYPNAAMTRYELGLALADLGEAQAAVAALRHAVRLNRDLAVAWRALGDRLFAAGDLDGAEAAFAEHGRAVVEDPALKPAAQALFEGRLADAEQLARVHLAAFPSDVAGLHLLATVLTRLGRWADAELLLAHCLTLDPRFDGARFALADALFHQQKGAQAAAQVERLLRDDPADPAYRNLMAACLGLVGEDARVIALYEGLLADYPQQPKVWLNYGHALRTVGRRDEAVAAYKRCIQLAPDLGDAYWSLANLKVAAFADTEVAAMAAALSRADLAVEHQLHMRYALGKALEDRKDPAGAFENYAHGAALRRAASAYDARDLTALVERSKALFTGPFFEARSGFGAASDAPIFILGLPRSGSTLVEQILASHSQVEGTMELPDIGLIAQGFAERYPRGLAGLDGPAAAALGEGFLASTQVHRKWDRPFFIDKMPNNFQHIGLIHLILPNAKIIDARRHPLGACFSAFKQHFAQGQAFSYDLTDLGLYYRDYLDLMTHFDAVLPGRIHRVIYEDLVEDTETEVRRLLDHCGLAFEPGCLAFHQNDRAVRTVSSEQVRQPIFRQGLDQWRAYEPWLGSLKTALGPALEDWRGAEAGH
ncbi:tetratricopeptide repeat-containing sulfotransferase family protein [soil metagenome]